ncbi:hypothetical protein IEQ34_021822 [Dendrobium chrysotoxum]|uniref:rRNA biogenesis protein RRP36 n=1 Tax=Dendrobium chrysotoxum TaxID=161865 RepID=A0AAV7FX64_DENCH|nr:hypothetical protein IEQ34_021822 [Dendrobium chrysotoxum]
MPVFLVDNPLVLFIDSSPVEQGDRLSAVCALLPLNPRVSQWKHRTERGAMREMEYEMCRDCTRRYFGSFLAVRLRSFDDFPFLSDRKLRHFDRKQQRELAGSLAVKKSKAPTVAAEGETAINDKNEKIGSWDQKQQENLEQELAHIPFEELQKARADGSHVIRLNTAYMQPDKPGRANKNRPMEISSKVRVGRYKEVIQAPKRVVRDPRFESLCGNLDTEGFRNRYSFLYEVELPAEKAKLQKLIKKSKDPNIIEDLKNHISWIDKQLKSSSPKNMESEILSEHIKKEKEAAKHGKHPYYLKKSVIRERKLIKKYNELKASGKLDSFIEKKRKKNASKDHRFMPYRKSSDDDISKGGKGGTTSANEVNLVNIVVP